MDTMIVRPPTFTPDEPRPSFLTREEWQMLEELRSRKSIQERFRGFTGTYDAEMIDFGPPAGKEIW
jgi:hypothetical protein